jgi:signal peptidase II
LGNWNWYVFNIADIAIVAGVGLLLYDGLFSGGDEKSG